MSAIHQEPASLEAATELAPSPPLLRTLVACDLVESTALTEQIGDRSIAEVMHLLDRHARDLVERHGGQEIDKTDGFLLMFDRPVQAIGFALDFQRLLHDLSLSEFLPLKARIGIHVGDVVLWRNTAADIARGAKPLEVEGLVKPVAARLMGLALPGQILMSGVARALALRAQDELETDFPPEWRMHGRYVFKGVAEPVPVFEVGETGIAPLRAPAYSGKAYRETPWWRRPGLLALEAAALLAAVVVPAWIFLRSPPVIAFAERDWVVVGSLKNLTEEHRFDDALDTAFRLGLGQSRYVNVLSDLKVRDTLALMQREPEHATLDRVTGSEVALRGGARALILPTVAEIGRNVRVTAEVIDPRSQTTVYTESADGVGAESVLASVDLINQHLRERLGEALASVEKDSSPLDRVATGNLDALRAYSLAMDAYNRYRYAESRHLVTEAIKLDPGFALAHVHLARLSLTTDDRREPAIEELEKALGSTQRLSPRDRLYIEAWLSSLNGAPRPALEKWQTLAALYPDFLTGQSLFAYYSFNLGNRAGEDVLGAAERAVSPQHPHSSVNKFLLANLYLFNGRYKQASQQYTLAEKDSTVNLFSAALPYAAQRDFAKVDASIARGKFSDVAVANMERYALRAAIAYDRGRTDEAFALLEQGQREATGTEKRYAHVFAGMTLSLRALDAPPASLRRALDDFAAAAREELAAATPADKPDARFELLFAAYLAAQLHERALAAALIADAGNDAASGEWPMLQKLLIVAKARLALSDGKPDEAISLAGEMLDGTELCLTHVVLMDAYQAQKNLAAANEQARWLASHRGRAYAEPGVRQLLNPLNVAAAVEATRTLEEPAPPASARQSP